MKSSKAWGRFDTGSIVIVRCPKRSQASKRTLHAWLMPMFTKLADMVVDLKMKNLVKNPRGS